MILFSAQCAVIIPHTDRRFPWGLKAKGWRELVGALMRASADVAPLGDYRQQDSVELKRGTAISTAGFCCLREFRVEKARSVRFPYTPTRHKAILGK